MQKPSTVSYDTGDTRRSKSVQTKKPNRTFIFSFINSFSSSSVPNGKTLFRAHALFMKLGAKIQANKHQTNRTKHSEQHRPKPAGVKKTNTKKKKTNPEKVGKYSHKKNVQAYKLQSVDKKE